MNNQTNLTSPSLSKREEKRKLKEHKKEAQIQSGKRAKNFKNTMKLLLKRVGTYKTSIIIAVIFAIISSILVVIGPSILNELMQIIIPDGNGVLDYQTSTVVRYGLIILGIYLLASGLNYIQNLLISRMSIKVAKKMRTDISKKINKLPLSYFDKNSYGDVLSRVTNDIDIVASTLERTLSSIVTAVVMIIGIPIIMLTINWQLTLISLLQIPLSLTIVIIVVKNNQKHFIRQQKYLGEINGYIEEQYSAHNVIKAFNGEEKAQEEFEKINKKLQKTAHKAQFFSNIMHPIVNLISNLIYVLICLVGAYIAIQSNDPKFLATIGTFMTYTKLFNHPISQLGSISSNLQSTMAAAERVFEFLSETEQPLDDDKLTTIPVVKGKIEFKNVNFGYSKDKQIIYDFNFTALPGEKIAIVGQTGAGKTTMVNLLMRFYDITSGDILIDGISIKDMSRNYVRSLFGMVLQDTWLFEGSIKENLRFGKPDATDEELVNACKLANVDHFIHTEPKGYDMILNEDTSISAGQKQLLTIARAMVQNAPMLILDEATSSVDTRTEILIQSAMDRLTEGRTSFVIAHRLSTIKNADKIIVMQDGNIVETGNHKELLAKNGVYKELYTSQFETGENF
ncbi:MAG: ABC transporter ATP-binding protein [Clostridiales bacterium]|nr:ABC transporter ATP-binding protein [Clostridiales bacterium]